MLYLNREDSTWIRCWLEVISQWLKKLECVNPSSNLFLFFWRRFWLKSPLRAHLFSFLLKLYFEREKVWVEGGAEREKEREREGERESQAGSMLSAQSPTQDSTSGPVKSWSEPKSKVWGLIRQSHPGAAEHIYQAKYFLHDFVFLKCSENCRQFK